MFEKLCYTQCRHCRCRTQLLLDFLKSMKRITDFITDLGQCRGLQESNAYTLYLKSHISIPLILLFRVIWFPLQLSPVLMLANIKKNPLIYILWQNNGLSQPLIPTPKTCSIIQIRRRKEKKEQGRFWSFMLSSLPPLPASVSRRKPYRCIYIFSSDMKYVTPILLERQILL